MLILDLLFPVHSGLAPWEYSPDITLPGASDSEEADPCLGQREGNGDRYQFRGVRASFSISLRTH
jgi:hypothetical protein